jgi:hypothetical protein
MKMINRATLKTENASLMRKRPSSPQQRIPNHALHKEYWMAALFGITNICFLWISVMLLKLLHIIMVLLIRYSMPFVAVAMDFCSKV